MTKELAGLGRDVARADSVITELQPLRPFAPDRARWGALRAWLRPGPVGQAADAAARKGRHGGRPPVITDDMLHTVLRRRANGESVEDIRPDLIISTGKRRGKYPSLASIYRALAEHAQTQVYPEAVDQAHAEFAALPART
ncbi:hypothetical protein ABZU32_39650 [Sphaerisporangium sp. NPDC005288]|uniref:hypothetical protein n=1 Tax=Sphaerisporangium sp. NPDC005288 TaxID=3155114 RepID=UPI0033BE165E